MRSKNNAEALLSAKQDLKKLSKDWINLSALQEQRAKELAIIKDELNNSSSDTRREVQFRKLGREKELKNIEEVQIPNLQKAISECEKRIFSLENVSTKVSQTTPPQQSQQNATKEKVEAALSVIKERMEKIEPKLINLEAKISHDLQKVENRMKEINPQDLNAAKELSRLKGEQKVLNGQLGIVIAKIETIEPDYQKLRKAEQYCNDKLAGINQKIDSNAVDKSSAPHDMKATLQTAREQSRDPGVENTRPNFTPGSSSG